MRSPTNERVEPPRIMLTRICSLVEYASVFFFMRAPTNERIEPPGIIHNWIVEDTQTEHLEIT